MSMSAKNAGCYSKSTRALPLAPLTTCKKEGCGGEVRRLISSGGGFIFKGSGFYQTDYRSESYTKAAKSAESRRHPAVAPAATPAATVGQTVGERSSAASSEPKTNSR